MEKQKKQHGLKNFKSPKIQDSVVSLKLPFRKHSSSEALFSSYKGCQLQKLSTIKDCLSLKVVFNWRVYLCSTKSRLPSKVVFHQKSSSIKYHLLSKAVSHHWLSFINSNLPPKVLFQKGFLPSMAIFHQRRSSIKGCLPSNVVFYQTEGNEPHLRNHWNVLII